MPASDNPRQLLPAADHRGNPASFGAYPAAPRGHQPLRGWAGRREVGHPQGLNNQLRDAVKILPSFSAACAAGQRNRLLGSAFRADAAPARLPFCNTRGENSGGWRIQARL